jgi:hypothetical protein
MLIHCLILKKCKLLQNNIFAVKFFNLFLEHVFKKMSSIEIVPLSVCHLLFRHEYKLRTMYLPGVRLDFLIRGLVVLELGPEPDPLQIVFL